ncbi:MAG: TetR/AcrR family transcriptional regulator [Deltaproteobacteria bacterium]|nr:TetR/AcrR family transcriptional regulator [Candidatus Zymogenaceae bacterium]
MNIERENKRKTIPRNPVQDRGIKTKQKLIETGKEIFSKHGFHDITADEIAHSAGLSVGTFYAYFIDKQDIFFAVLDDYLMEFDRIISEGIQNFLAITDADISTTLTNIVRLVFKEHKKSSFFMKEFIKMSLSDEEVNRRLHIMDMRVRDVLTENLLAIGIDEKRAVSISFVIYYALEGVIHKIALDDEEVDENAVLLELTSLLSGYIVHLSLR